MINRPTQVIEGDFRFESEKNGTQLCLWFTSERELELIKTLFKSPLLSEPVVAVRGKTAGAFSTSATFQWTSAVQALAVLLVKAAARHEMRHTNTEPLLEGGRGSMASSLDASLYKQTAWLDLFGANMHGDCLSRRVLNRTNPGRRRAGPVMLSLNERVLPAASVEIYIDGKRVQSPEELSKLMNVIQKTWASDRARSPLQVN